MASSTPPSNFNEIAVRLSNGIEVSRNDKRVWSHAELKNGLRVMLIQDAESEMAGAALGVDIGSHGDPRDIPGLAHFLEHMLFLGTEK
jgi:insulysin